MTTTRAIQHKSSIFFIDNTSELSQNIDSTYDVRSNKKFNQRSSGIKDTKSVADDAREKPSECVNTSYLQETFDSPKCVKSFSVCIKKNDELGDGKHGGNNSTNKGNNIDHLGSLEAAHKLKYVMRRTMSSDSNKNLKRIRDAIKIQLPRSPNFLGRSFSSSDNIQSTLNVCQESVFKKRPPWNMNTKIELTSMSRYTNSFKTPKYYKTQSLNKYQQIKRYHWKNGFLSKIKADNSRAFLIKTTYATKLESSVVKNHHLIYKVHIIANDSKFAFKENIVSTPNEGDCTRNFITNSKVLNHSNIMRWTENSKCSFNNIRYYPLYAESDVDVQSESRILKIINNSTTRGESMSCNSESRNDVDDSLDGFMDSILTSTWGTPSQCPEKDNLIDVDQRTPITPLSLTLASTDFGSESPFQKGRQSFFCVLQKRLKEIVSNRNNLR